MFLKLYHFGTYKIFYGVSMFSTSYIIFAIDTAVVVVVVNHFGKYYNKRERRRVKRFLPYYFHKTADGDFVCTAPTKSSSVQKLNAHNVARASTIPPDADAKNANAGLSVWRLPCLPLEQYFFFFRLACLSFAYAVKIELE